MITAVIMAHGRTFTLSNIHDSLCGFGGLESYQKLFIHTQMTFSIFFFFYGIMYYDYLNTPNLFLNWFFH